MSTLILHSFVKIKVDPYTATYGDIFGTGFVKSVTKSGFPVQDIYHRNGVGYGNTPVRWDITNAYENMTCILSFVSIFILTGNMFYWIREVKRIRFYNGFLGDTTISAAVVPSRQQVSVSPSPSTIRMISFNSSYQGGMFMGFVSYINLKIWTLYKESGGVDGYYDVVTPTTLCNYSSYIYMEAGVSYTNAFDYLNYAPTDIYVPYALTIEGLDVVLSPYIWATGGNYKIVSERGSAFVLENYTYTPTVRPPLSGDHQTIVTYPENLYNFNLGAGKNLPILSLVSYNKDVSYVWSYMSEWAYNVRPTPKIEDIFAQCKIYGMSLNFMSGLTSKTTSIIRICSLGVWNGSVSNVISFESSNLFPSTILGYNLNHTLGINNLCASPSYPNIGECNMEGIAYYPTNEYNTSTNVGKGLIIGYTYTDSHLRWYIWNTSITTSYNDKVHSFVPAVVNGTDLSNTAPWTTVMNGIASNRGIYQVQMNASCTQMLIYTATIRVAQCTFPSGGAIQGLAPACVATIDNVYGFARTAGSTAWKSVTKSMYGGSVFDSKIINGRVLSMAFTDRHPIDYTKMSITRPTASYIQTINEMRHLVLFYDYLRLSAISGDSWMWEDNTYPPSGSENDIAVYAYNVKFAGV